MFLIRIFDFSVLECELGGDNVSSQGQKFARANANDVLLLPCCLLCSQD